MTEDIDYCPAISIYNEDGSYAVDPMHPSHLPYTEALYWATKEGKQKGLAFIEELRQKHGLKKKEKKPSKPLTYVCTTDRCIDSYRGNGWASNERKRSSVPDQDWLKRLRVKANQLPSRIITRNEHEAT